MARDTDAYIIIMYTDAHIRTWLHIVIYHVAFPNKGKFKKKKSLCEVTLSYS